LHRIVFNVGDRGREVIVVPHEAIEVFAAPQTPFAVKVRIDLMGRGRFPGLNNACERESLALLNHCMNVIGHHAPRDELVSFAVRVEKCCLDGVGARRIPELARAVPGIQQSIRVLN